MIGFSGYHPNTTISGPIRTLVVYSGLFMRFAWRVRPRNYILLACHTASRQVQRIISEMLLLQRLRGHGAAARARGSSASAARRRRMRRQTASANYYDAPSLSPNE